MKLSIGSLKNRRCKYLSHWNIHICRAVFKYRLLLWILQRMKLYCQVCPVFVLSGYAYSRALIQRINQRLLHSSVNCRIQRIYADHFIKNLLIFRPDFRNRIGNDRKAPLIALNIFVHHLPGSAGKGQKYLLLLIRQMHRLFLHLRNKRPLTEHFHNCRSGKPGRQFPMRLVCMAHHIQLPLCKPFI